MPRRQALASGGFGFEYESRTLKLANHCPNHGFLSWRSTSMHFRITRSPVFGPVLNEVSCPFNPKSSPVSHGPLILGYFSSLHLLMPEIILNNIYVFVLCPLPPSFTSLECMFFVGKSSVCCTHFCIFST